MYINTFTRGQLVTQLTTSDIETKLGHKWVNLMPVTY